MTHNAIHVINSKKYHIKQAPLDEMIAFPDPDHGNPTLWWVTDLETYDLIVPGVATLKDALEAIEP